MFKKRQLFFSLVLVSFLSACSTSHNVDASRAIAGKAQGINYPEYASFDLKNDTGKTYAYFMKTKVKPTLDRFSDKSNGGGGGFDNIGSKSFLENSALLDSKTLLSYKGAKWNRNTKTYENALTDEQVVKVYETLKKIKPRSTVDSLSYFDRDDKAWPTKNDMAVAIKEAKINSAPFDLGTLYALTGGMGVKVKIDENNFNYHVLYKTGYTNPSVEVMSGRSFASSPTSGVTDATDPEYLRDLRKYLDATEDVKPFYSAMILALGNCDPAGWSTLTDLGQTVLSDFFTVYTAEADRHLMVDLKTGKHPWEIDLAAVTAVSVVSARTGKVVINGTAQDSDLGGWFAPSPNNKPGGPQRSGIGITRKDRKILQRAIHDHSMKSKEGKRLIADIQAIIGTKVNKNDVIQGVFEFLSNKDTPESLGPDATRLADLFSRFVEAAGHDAAEIIKTLPQS